MAYKSGNPALNKKTFQNFPKVNVGHMTLEGVSLRSLFMILLCLASGAWAWNYSANAGDIGAIAPLLGGSIAVALIVAIITIFKPTFSPFTAPLYAIIEGIALGIISQLYEAAFGGIVLQALLLTGGIFISMLILYLTRLVRATENFKLGVMAATGGIFIYYFTSLVAGFFGKNLPLIASNSVWGIGFTIAVIIIAALNLVVDFDFIEQGVIKKAPKYMEWYASFGLFVTIVWLYLELLRLLGKIKSK